MDALLISDIIDQLGRNHGIDGTRSCCKLPKAECPFCYEEKITQNLWRHVEGICETAKIECRGRDLGNEFEEKQMNRKGFGEIGIKFQK